jgi:hypothetical protein
MTRVVPRLESRTAFLRKHGQMGSPKCMPAEAREIQLQLFEDRFQLAAEPRPFIERLSSSNIKDSCRRLSAVLQHGRRTGA